MEPVVLQVRPGFAAGHMFSWALDPAFSAPGPFYFRVQQGHTHDGPWFDLSPELQDEYLWVSEKMVAPKDPVLYFRVTLRSGTKTWASPVRTPYGDLDRREFLLVADIMRRELLAMRQMTGVPVKVFVKAVFGPACTRCRDPITGEVLNANCAQCFGTGRVPGYHGPYETWAVFSVGQRAKQMAADPPGVTEPSQHEVRTLGSPSVKKDDVLIDERQDARYYVDGVLNAAEVRRVPVIQNLVVRAIPNSSPIYELGSWT